MTMEAGKYGSCRSCHAPVLWAINMTTDRLAPLDAKPDPAHGNIETFERGGQLHYRVLNRQERQERIAGGDDLSQLRVSHYATCPFAQDWRGRARGR